MKLLRVLPVALLAMALMLVVASGASAATTITATHVDSPTGPVFGIQDESGPLTYTVTGTATGATPGEEIDLRCYYTSTSSDMMSGAIPVEPDGSFTATEVEPRIDAACTVRAVPSGTEPTGSELAAFSGPVFAIGESEVSTSNSTPYDFYTWGQQLKAAFDYDSINSCGIDDGYLNTVEFETVTTFWCNDWFEGKNSASTSSGFQVGGQNAYFSTGARNINSGAAGIPPMTYSYSQNPLNGDLTIRDSESAVLCPTSEFPPQSSNCTEFLPSGVRDSRTIEQSHDGQVSVITDQFSSTDDEAHSVEATPQNDQYFNSHGTELEYDFPGVGYVKPTVNQSIGFADSTPGAVYVKVAGAEDGDLTTGRGAIVFFQPSSPATVDYSTYYSGFTFDNHLTVPATGTTTVKYAYVQALHQAEVESMVTELLTPPATTTPVTTPAPAPVATPKPSVTVKFGKVKLAKKKGTAKLQVKVSGPGTLKLTGKKVKSKSVKVKKAGTVTVAVVPTAATKKVLRKNGTAKVVVKVAFKGTNGAGTSKTKKIKLLLKG